jgi:hypothetical protein
MLLIWLRFEQPVCGLFLPVLQVWSPLPVLVQLYGLFWQQA